MDLQNYIRGGKVIEKTIIMALFVMVMDGLLNEHINFLYGLYMFWGNTQHLKGLFRYSCTGQILTLSSPMKNFKCGTNEGNSEYLIINIYFRSNIYV